jgi:5'-methylthioadenosine phosphorylase
MADNILGVIGGSGLYQMEDLKILETQPVSTPFGDPSAEIVIGELNGVRLAFLPRHGLGHTIPPSEINFRANIFAMKKIGVDRILSISAVGSMKKEIAPGHFVVPDQFIDWTRQRINTFFTKGIVGHVSLADPICPQMAKTLAESARSTNTQTHEGGTYICIDGPQFSTRGESNVYRQWGVDIIGMTNMTEAKLAREAGICYSTLALVTDYDCWHVEEEAVTVEAVIEIMHQNVTKAQLALKEFVTKLDKNHSCQCASAAKNAIVTNKDLIPVELRGKLAILFEKFL